MFRASLGRVAVVKAPVSQPRQRLDIGDFYLFSVPTLSAALRPLQRLRCSDARVFRRVLGIFPRASGVNAALLRLRNGHAKHVWMPPLRRGLASRWQCPDSPFPRPKNQTSCIAGTLPLRSAFRPLRSANRGLLTTHN